MSIDIARWAHEIESLPRKRNSHVQVWLFLAMWLLGIGGGFYVQTVGENAGLYIPPAFAALARGTFDYLNIVFMFMWASTFQSLSVHDGLHYRLRFRTALVRRSIASDVLSLIAFPLIAVLWGELAVHTVFAHRAIDPRYVSRLPYGTPAETLQHGVGEVMTAYFVVVGIAFALIMVARLFNPADLDECDRYFARILPVPRAATARPRG
jgi:hypothetical protein